MGLCVREGGSGFVVSVVALGALAASKVDAERSVRILKREGIYRAQRNLRGITNEKV